MDEKKLYQIIDFILNDADSGEIDVIRAALRKREGRGMSDGNADIGQRIGRMAKQMAEKVGGQVGVSEQKIRQTVRGFVKDMIAREAPELREAQVNELLDRWVPDPGSAGRKSGGQKRDVLRKGGREQGLPQDALFAMVRQFVAFATGKMTEAEDAELSAEIPQWQNRYWARFSPVIQKLIDLYVKGIMSEKDFWKGVYDELGYDASGSPSGT